MLAPITGQKSPTHTDHRRLVRLLSIMPPALKLPTARWRQPSVIARSLLVLVAAGMVLGAISITIEYRRLIEEDRVAYIAATHAYHIQVVRSTAEEARMRAQCHAAESGLHIVSTCGSTLTTPAPSSKASKTQILREFLEAHDPCYVEVVNCTRSGSTTSAPPVLTTEAKSLQATIASVSWLPTGMDCANEESHCFGVAHWLLQTGVGNAPSMVLMPFISGFAWMLFFLPSYWLTVARMIGLQPQPNLDDPMDAAAFFQSLTSPESTTATAGQQYIQYPDPPGHVDHHDDTPAWNTEGWSWPGQTVPTKRSRA